MRGCVPSRNKQGDRYPFWIVKEGTAWMAQSIREAESIQSSFTAYAKRIGSPLRCRYASVYEDGYRRIRITFLNTPKRQRRRK